MISCFLHHSAERLVYISPGMSASAAPQPAERPKPQVSAFVSYARERFIEAEYERENEFLGCRRERPLELFPPFDEPFALQIARDMLGIRGNVFILARKSNATGRAIGHDVSFSGSAVWKRLSEFDLCPQGRKAPGAGNLEFRGLGKRTSSDGMVRRTYPLSNRLPSGVQEGIPGRNGTHSEILFV
jgi:hypothetical protein